MSKSLLERLNEVWGAEESAAQTPPPDDLSPPSWDEFVGHERVKRLLRSTTAAAKMRQEPTPPILLWGPPGCGKTTLAVLMGREFERFTSLHCQGLTGAALAATLLKTTDGLVFLDELHEFSEPAALVPILDNGAVTRFGRQTRITASVVAATTDPSSFSPALRSRFMLEILVDQYTPVELAVIAIQKGKVLDLNLSVATARTIGRHSRGEPRLAIRILLRMRDLHVLDEGRALDELIEIALEDLGFDSLGFLEAERLYLGALYRLGGRTGVSNLSAVLGLGTAEVKAMEKHLLRRGYVSIESRGRALTLEGFELFN